MKRNAGTRWILNNPWKYAAALAVPLGLLEGWLQESLILGLVLAGGFFLLGGWSCSRGPGRRMLERRIQDPNREPSGLRLLLVVPWTIGGLAVTRAAERHNYLPAVIALLVLVAYIFADTLYMRYRAHPGPADSPPQSPA